VLIASLTNPAPAPLALLPRSHAIADISTEMAMLAYQEVEEVGWGWDGNRAEGGGITIIHKPAVYPATAPA
jgi:hypothetical protein